MTKYEKPGKTMTFTAPAGGVTVDVPVLIGALLVIPTTTVAAGLPFEGMTEGQFKNMPKAAGAWTEGQLLYWDSAAGNFATAQSATARRVGVAVAAAANGDATGTVRLTGAPSVVNVA